jgi:hypothetical protein
MQGISYKAYFGVKKRDIGPENTYFLNDFVKKAKT